MPGFHWSSELLTMTRGYGPKIQPVNPTPRTILDAGASLSCDGNGSDATVQPTSTQRL